MKPAEATAAAAVARPRAGTRRRATRRLRTASRPAYPLGSAAGTRPCVPVVAVSRPAAIVAVSSIAPEGNRCPRSPRRRPPSAGVRRTRRPPRASAPRSRARRRRCRRSRRRRRRSRRSSSTTASPRDSSPRCPPCATCSATRRPTRPRRSSGACSRSRRCARSDAADTADQELAPHWREGGYPYLHRLSRRNYERQKYRLQVELLKFQNWVKDSGQKLVDPVRGPRRGRQGRHDQALHGAPQSARRARGRAREAVDRRTRPVVLPALRPAPADRGRDRAVRPLLVQPRRRRARDGLLQRPRVRGVPAPGARVRAQPRAERRAPLQVLVLGEPRGAGAPLPGARAASAQAVEALARSTSRRSTSGTTTRRRRRRCSPTPTRRTRRGW